MNKQNWEQLRHQGASYLIALLLATFTGFIGSNSVSLAAESSLPAISESIATLKESQKQWIEINLSTQRLIAWEGDQSVYEVIVSTGKKSTPTRTGLFMVQRKYRSDRMRGADYDISGVPYVMYYDRGYAIHGANWHNRFGTPITHGCVNVPVDHAAWLFDWATKGMSVVIHEGVSHENTNLLQEEMSDNP